MSLKEILCQDRAIGLLQRAFVSGKSAHAYIFAGPDGVGKFKTACEWAKLLLCSNPVMKRGFADSCGLCESCKLFEAGSNPDFHHVYKELREFTIDGKGKGPPVDLPIDVIREFLIAKVPIRPSLSSRKVFVVGEAEKLNDASQNCLLKVLEEPPGYCCIILLCTRLEKLLPTTRSRSQIVQFGPVAEDKIISKLEQMNIERGKAVYFARLARGSLGAACQWMELELAGSELFQTKKELIRFLADLELSDAVDMADKILAKCRKTAAVWSDIDKTTSKTDINRRVSKTIIQMIMSSLYDVIMLQLKHDEEIVNSDQKRQIERLAGRFDIEQAANEISNCYKMLHWVESSVNERLIFEQLLLNLVDSDKIPIL